MSEPPIKVVPDVPESPFDALLRSARTDPDAAAGLALAYADMSEPAREKLLEVLSEGDGAEVLALMLGVEESPALAEKIAQTLRRDVVVERKGAPREGQRRGDQGFAWGRREAGGVALIRRLHGGFVEGVSVTWAEREADVSSVPLASANDRGGLRRKLLVPDDASEVSLEEATDRLAEGLWRLRRRLGSLPDVLRPVAGLLVPRA